MSEPRTAMAGREPSQITVNVRAARNLQGKKKGETCHASVVFGIGKQQFVTEVFESNSPEWNQEATLNLSNKDQNQMIKFKVRDNHHVLGVVRLSVNNLPGRRPKPKWESLTAYKKAGEVFGELQIECYVSEFRPGHVLSNSEKSSPLQSRFGSQEDILDVSKKGRFSFHRRTPSSGRPQSGFVPVSEGEGEVDGAVKASKVVDASVSSSDSKEFESSDLKLTKSVRNNPFVPPSTSFTSLTVSSASEAQSVADSRGASPTTSEVLTCPQVTGVSPREGPMEGGQKVVLRGSNLGESRDDILRVTVADVDCTSTLEYISPSKLTIITSSRYTPGVGPVKVETQSGGLGVSSVNFTFVENAIARPPEVSGISPSSGPIEGGQRVVLRGNNLGECKEDVVRVVLAGVDCTETLEFFSPSKLAVTALPRSSAGEGEVLVDTARGGVSQSSMVFMYMEKVISISSHSKSLEAAKKQQEEKHQVELKALKSQVRELKDDNSKLRERNQALRNYIDHLLLSVLDVRPDLLEIKPSHSMTSTSTTPSRASVTSNS